MTETRIKLYTRNPEHSTFDHDQMQKEKKNRERERKRDGADHLRLFV